MHKGTDRIGVRIQTSLSGVLVRCAPGQVVEAIEWRESRLLPCESVQAVSVRHLAELADTGPVDFTDGDADRERREWQDGLDADRIRNREIYGSEQ